MSAGISPFGSASSAAAAYQAQGARAPDVADKDNAEVRKQFDQFVGETFYGQMLAAMRKTVGKSAYFDGGRAEEVFRGQLDQILAEKMTHANGGAFADGMFEQFMLSQNGRN
jgi:peptidoglycan hydrolase FlgJ